MLPTTNLSCRSLRISFMLLLLIICFGNSALAEMIGRLTQVEGSVEIMHAGKFPARATKAGDPVERGDFIRTKSNARAEITFNDGNVMKIAQRSRIDVNEYSSSNRQIKLPRGKVQAIVQPAAAGAAPHRFEIRTPNAIVGVRGTTFFVYHVGNVTGVAVTQGTVHTASLALPTQGVNLRAGTATSVATGQAPAPPRPMSDTELKGHSNDVTPTTPQGGSGESGDQGGSAPAAPSASSSSGTPATVDPGALSTMNDSLQTVTKSDNPTPKPVWNPPPRPEPPPPPLDCQDPTAPGCTESPIATTIGITQPTTPTPPPTPPASFSSTLAAGLMSRGATIDPLSNLLQIISDGGIGPILSGTAPLWAGSAAATLTGTYPALPLQQPNHYWFGSLFSESTASHTTTDGGAYYGYFGGMSLDGTGSTDTIIDALYVDPDGRAGIMRGNLTGTITGGALSSSGTLTLTELNAAIGLNPALFGINWWDPKDGTIVSEVTGPVLTQANPGGFNDNSADGFLLDAGLNITSQMSNRGDVLRLSFFDADPSFGIWTRESFGTFNGNNTRYVLGSQAQWGTLDAVTGIIIPTHEINLISLGNWQTNGKLDGTADGVWGDWAAGKLRLLTGTVTGSSNITASTFGAIGNGVFLDVARFLANPALAAQLGFPTQQSVNTFSLTNSNGSVSIPNLTFYSRAAGDPISLWVASVSGSYSGGPLQQQRYTLMNAGTTTSTIFGSLRIKNAGISPVTGGNVWLGSIEGLGELAPSFRSDFDGIATGTFTAGTFSGTAAGFTHPVTYYSTIGGTSALISRYFNTAIASYGSFDGVIGGMSLWGSTPANSSDFKGIGFLTPSPSFSDFSDFVFSSPIISRDIPNGTNTTADGGAYHGHLVAGISTLGGNNSAPPVAGLLDALYIDPDGNAGVLHGKSRGFVDPQNSAWNLDGTVFPTTLATATGGITAANLNDVGNVIITETDYYGGSSFTGSSPSPGPPVTTGAVGTNDRLIRSHISTMPDWGIARFSLFTTYSNPPTGPWNIDFNIADGLPANISYQGTMAGDLWNTANGINQLHAFTRAGWLDFTTATPQTGIFIGETVGTFNAASMQALTSGTWLETAKFLSLASTTAGRATLQRLNIPSVEVGVASFSGSVASSYDVNVNDLKFFAPVGNTKPQIWASGNISGNFTTSLPFGTANLTQTSGSANISGLAPSFSINRWDTLNNKWSATISNTGGIVNGQSIAGFSGPAAGSHSGGVSGTFSGTGAGVVK